MGRLKEQDDALLLEPSGDRLSADQEFGRQLVDRRPRLVAFDQASKLGCAQLLCPLWMRPARFFARRCRKSELTIGGDGPAQRRGGHVRQRSGEDHQSIRMRTLHSIVVACCSLRTALLRDRVGGFCLRVMTLVASKQGNQVSEPWWVGSRRLPDASGMKQ